jgi:SprT-like protein
MKVKHFELVKESEDFLKENFKLDLEIPIIFNTRLKKVFGRLIYKNLGKMCVPIKIEMSVDFMISHPRERIIDVLKHELVHYALCVQGLPFDDGHPVFENKLKELGVNSTRTYEYLGELHRYECINCRKVYERKRKLVKTAFCNCSKGPNLSYKGTFFKKHENMVAYTSEEIKQKKD